MRREPHAGVQLNQAPAALRGQPSSIPYPDSTNTSFQCMLLAFLSFPSTLIPQRCPVQGMKTSWKITSAPIFQSFLTTALLMHVSCLPCGNKGGVGVWCCWATSSWLFSCDLPHSGCGSSASAYTSSVLLQWSTARSKPSFSLCYPRPRSTSLLCWAPAATSGCP